MDIAEAARKGKYIKRKGWPDDWAIQPTNSELCCTSMSNGKLLPRWEPQRKDLVADDWEPVRER